MFLGPENCYISIVGGNATDWTSDKLNALRLETSKLGVAFSLTQSGLNPQDDARI